MRYLLRTLLIPLCLIVSLHTGAAVEVFDFSSTENRKRFHYLVDELRCPKCQNQNLGGSDSPIAMDLKRELYRMIEAGKTDSEIKSFMVSRYGDYVLYRPPVQSNTLLLWWGPPAVFGLGLLIVVILAWRRQRLLKQDDSELSEEDLARLNQLLAQQRAAADASKSTSDGNS